MCGRRRRYPNYFKPFSDVQEQHLLLDLLSKPTIVTPSGQVDAKRSGAGMNVSELKAKGLVALAFPLHSRSRVQWFFRYWVNVRCRRLHRRIMRRTRMPQLREVSGAGLCRYGVRCVTSWCVRRGVHQPVPCSVVHCTATHCTATQLTLMWFGRMAPSLCVLFGTSGMGWHVVWDGSCYRWLCRSGRTAIKQVTGIGGGSFSVAKNVVGAPLNAVREYWGSKLAFYFTFLGFYTLHLIRPSLYGIALQMVKWLDKSVELNGLSTTEWLTVGYSVYMMLWSTFVLEQFTMYSARKVC